LLDDDAGRLEITDDADHNEQRVPYFTVCLVLFKCPYEQESDKHTNWDSGQLEPANHDRVAEFNPKSAEQEYKHKLKEVRSITLEYAFMKTLGRLFFRGCSFWHMFPSFTPIVNNADCKHKRVYYVHGYEENYDQEGCGQENGAKAPSSEEINQEVIIGRFALTYSATS
jgi:hypothetical protein